MDFVVFHTESQGQWVPNTFRPRVQLRPKDSKQRHRLAGGDMNSPTTITGCFLDLKSCVALRNKES